MKNSTKIALLCIITVCIATIIIPVYRKRRDESIIQEETAKMFKKDRSARKFFLDRMADLRMMGFKCLEEEDDYFKDK